MPSADPLPIDPLLSYARRDGDHLKVVLVVPATKVDRPRARLRFESSEGRGFGVPAEITQRPDGVTIVARTPLSDLPDGVWRLRLRVRPQERPRPLRTRLLVNASQPVALLPRFDVGVVGA